MTKLTKKQKGLQGKADSNMASSIKLDLPKTDAAKPNEAPRFILLVLDRGRPGVRQRPAGDAGRAGPAIGANRRAKPRHRGAIARR